MRAFREGGVTPTSNLVFFFDGEEEAGSRNLGRYMEMQADKLDGIDPIGDEEQAALASIPNVDSQLRRELGLAWTEGQPEMIAERLLLPALNVRGITSGNTGALARNVISNTAGAATRRPGPAWRAPSCSR